MAWASGRPGIWLWIGIDGGSSLRAFAAQREIDKYQTRMHFFPQSFLSLTMYQLHNMHVICYSSHAEIIYLGTRL